MSAALPMHESDRETRASQEREKDQRTGGRAGLPQDPSLFQLQEKAGGT